MTTLTDTELATALLDAIEHHILPLTRRGVATGSKVYGAAVLRKSDGTVVLAETNNEAENPLWHGEIHLLKRFHELPAADRPDPGDLIFLATHEPCPMCLSALALAGFDNFHDFFSHAQNRDSISIPHDLQILKQVFRLEPGGYNRTNSYWRARSVADVIAGADAAARPALRDRAAAIGAEYDRLAAQYEQAAAGEA